MLITLLKSLHFGGVKSTKTVFYNGEIPPSTVGNDTKIETVSEIHSINISYSKDVGAALRAEISFFDGFNWNAYTPITPFADAGVQSNRLRPSNMKNDALFSVINSEEGLQLTLKKPMTVRGIRIQLTNGDTIPHRMSLSMVYTEKGEWGAL